MQSTLLVLLAMAFGWCEMTGHPIWANLVFLVILGVWSWDLADRMNRADRKEHAHHEPCDR